MTYNRKGKHYFACLFFCTFSFSISYSITAKQNPFDAISGMLPVSMPLTSQNAFPIDTRYLTMFTSLDSIPAPLKRVAIQPIISAILIIMFSLCI